MLINNIIHCVYFIYWHASSIQETRSFGFTPPIALDDHAVLIGKISGADQALRCLSALVRHPRIDPAMREALRICRRRIVRASAYTVGTDDSRQVLLAASIITQNCQKAFLVLDRDEPKPIAVSAAEQALTLRDQIRIPSSCTHPPDLVSSLRSSAFQVNRACRMACHSAWELPGSSSSFLRVKIPFYLLRVTI